MKRRKVILGMLGAGAAVAGAALTLRPRDQGAPHGEYFHALNNELKQHGPMRPSLVVDLDRLDHNLNRVTASIARGGKHYRVVEKSLPCPQLLDYVMRKAGTRRLMSFHQPFLNQDAVRFPDADILLGKPLPVRSAALFYAQHRGAFDPARQLQWLVDTPERLQQYRELAQGLNTRLRINIELDVGLHRGGVSSTQMLDALLQLIEAHPQQLELSGFMGYDPFVGMGVPEILGSPQDLLHKVMTRYQAFVDQARASHPALWHEGLTLNTAGSPTYRLHEAERLSNDISVGTGLLKPAHYDLPSLAEHVPAIYIATPVLKSTGPLQLPALDERSRIFSWWDVNQRESFFIYGGHWQARYESPVGLRGNALYGRSANQEIATASASVGLKVDDQVFLRPEITEGVLLQFGELLTLRSGRIMERWPVYSG